MRLKGTQNQDGNKVLYRQGRSGRQGLGGPKVPRTTNRSRFLVCKRPEVAFSRASWVAQRARRLTPEPNMRRDMPSAACKPAVLSSAHPCLALLFPALWMSRLRSSKHTHTP